MSGRKACCLLEAIWALSGLFVGLWSGLERLFQLNPARIAAPIPSISRLNTEEFYFGLESEWHNPVAGRRG